MKPRTETAWSCIVGVHGEASKPGGADEPMRKAVIKAFREVTGRDPDFLFSGWGAELTDSQRQFLFGRGHPSPGPNGGVRAGPLPTHQEVYTRADRMPWPPRKPSDFAQRFAHRHDRVGYPWRSRVADILTGLLRRVGL